MISPEFLWEYHRDKSQDWLYIGGTFAATLFLLIIAFIFGPIGPFSSTMMEFYRNLPNRAANLVGAMSFLIYFGVSFVASILNAWNKRGVIVSVEIGLIPAGGLMLLVLFLFTFSGDIGGEFILVFIVASFIGVLFSLFGFVVGTVGRLIFNSYA